LFGAFLMDSRVRREDEEVLHVDNKPFFGNHVSEGIIHESLKGGGGVGKSKEHDCGFKEAFVDDESCFPLVAVLDMNIVVSSMNIKFGENLGIFKFINEVGD